MQRKTELLILALLLTVTVAAQNSLRIHYHDGTHSDIPLNSIDSISFIDSSTTPADEATLTGTWVWAQRDMGYYEVLTFNADQTYTGYDNYFSYGFDTQTFGFYSHYGALLTLWSNGFGYQWRYQWLVTMLTGNALSVVTRSGPFTYYRLHPDVIRLTLADGPQPLPEGSTLLFTDGTIIDTTTEGHLQPLLPGSTYVLLHNTTTNLTWAYRVVIN